MIPLLLACPTPTLDPREPEIPADRPEWATMRGFLNAPGAYGEASWDDVRMRVVGHIAVAGRDLARARAMAGDRPGCTAAYTETAARLDAAGGNGPTATPIREALTKALRRDAVLCAGGTPAATGLAALRTRAVTPEEVRNFPLPNLDLDAFADFEARHALRIRLVQAYADTVDPFAPTDPWGYWTVDEIRRQAEGLATGTVARQPVSWTVEELGALPTGDTLVDTAGFAGPRAIGKLAKLAPDDPEHRKWLEAAAKRLEKGDVATVTELAAELDKHPHGSRYYNIKQLKNAAVRQFARQGRYREADAIVASQWPLHNQDWACPNREGILLAIRGRLQLLAKDPNAEDTLRRSLRASEDFLANIR